MRGGKGLVQIDVYHVEAHITWPRHSHDGVEVRAVVIEQAACAMHDLCHGENVLFKQAQRVRVGEHQPGDFAVHFCAQVVEIHQAVFVAGDLHHVVAHHMRGGGIGAMRAVRHQHLGAFVVAAVLMVCTDHGHAGHFALRACGGLQGKRVHAQDFLEHFARIVQQREHALRVFFRQQWVQRRELARGPLVHLGVVFHGAAPQRIHAVVYAKGALGKLHEMPGEFHLGNLWQIGAFRAQKSIRYAHIFAHGGEGEPVRAGMALFKNQLAHRSAS